MKKITPEQINAVIRDLDKKTDTVIQYLLDIFYEEQPALCDYVHDADENMNKDEKDLLITTALMGWYIVRETLGCVEADDDLIDELLDENIDLFEEEYNRRADGEEWSPLALLSRRNGQRELMGFLASLIIDRPDDFSGIIRTEATLPMVMHVKTVVDCLTAGQTKAREYSEKAFKAAKKEVETIFASYKRSPFFMKLKPAEKEEAEFVVSAFGDMMYNYYLLGPAEWRLGAAEGCCLDIMPRKVMADAGFFACVEPVLRSFLVFGAESGAIPAGRRIAAGIEGIGAAVIENAEDPASWGPGKAMLKEATASGVDVGDPKELDAFIKRYNEGRNSVKGKGRKVPGGAKTPGRNDPCSCGSGKKYKKCCGAE